MHSELIREAESLLQSALMDLHRDEITRSVLFHCVHKCRHAAAILGRLDQDMAGLPPPKEGE